MKGVGYREIADTCAFAGATIAVAGTVYLNGKVKAIQEDVEKASKTLEIIKSKTDAGEKIKTQMSQLGQLLGSIKNDVSGLNMEVSSMRRTCASIMSATESIGYAVEKNSKAIAEMQRVMKGKGDTIESKPSDITAYDVSSKFKYNTPPREQPGKRVKFNDYEDEEDYLRYQMERAKSRKGF